MRGPCNCNCNCNCNGKRKQQLHVACNCNRDVIQQLTFAEEEKKEKQEEQKEQKGNKKEKVRTAFLPWIPKGVLRTQQNNFVYSTKLQQKLLHSTTLVALVQLQIHSRGTRAAQELTYGQS